MKPSFAVDCLSSLAQETRLNIFRLLVQNAPKGLPAGEIARRLKLPGPTLSFHLNILASTELIEAHRNCRSISYFANFQNFKPFTELLDGKLLRRTEVHHRCDKACRPFS